MQIAILLFDQLTALDAVGPYETLSRIPGATVTFVATEARPYRTDTGSLALLADATLDELAHPEIVVVPGGPGEAGAREDEATLGWLRTAHETSRWTTSVCTGSLVLAAAGLLRGLPATTHWSCYDELAAHGAEPTPERVVEHLDRRIITAAGVSSGIDMALRLTELLEDRTAAQAAQLMIEYDPQPPFDCGSVAKSDDVVMTRVIEYAALRS